MNNLFFPDGKSSNDCSLIYKTYSTFSITQGTGNWLEIIGNYCSMYNLIESYVKLSILLFKYI